ncbi:unnamed protein product [Lupinus luteus]|uniref:BPL/LPL catalytic domain-containing protein n=1 Tax=Lupinus luteus TaxID=3873 RepID=A0AAV1VQW1_LUPLU
MLAVGLMCRDSCHQCSKVGEAWSRKSQGKRLSEKEKLDKNPLRTTMSAIFKGKSFKKTQLGECSFKGSSSKSVYHPPSPSSNSDDTKKSFVKLEANEDIKKREALVKLDLIKNTATFNDNMDSMREFQNLNGCKSVSYTMSREEFFGRFPGNKKLAAIGLWVAHWITYHGLALNVTIDLNPFKWIIPCGICDRQVGSIKGLLTEAHSCVSHGTGYLHDLDDVSLVQTTYKSMVEEFSQVFMLEFQNKTIFIPMLYEMEKISLMQET